MIRHFSEQHSADKKRWLPCEHEALAVGGGLQTFLPFLKESNREPIINTVGTPNVVAYKKLQRGFFSSSPLVSTFLHKVVNQSAIVKYLAGPSNLTADLASRFSQQI